MILQPINIINGTSTNVGKTFVTCYIINEKKLNGKQINAIKPVISGFTFEEAENSDAGQILKALQSKLPLTEITRYFLKEPASINISALLENAELSYKEILNFCTEKIQNSLAKKEPILIEMSGGFCSPITNEKTMLDLTIDINREFKDLCKNFLITSNYLGAISHTISACKIFNFDEIVFNPFPASKHDELILETLRKFCKNVVPLGGLEPPRT